MSEQQTEYETAETAPEQDRDEDVDTAHLDDMDDGCGCTEVWEHLSDEREEDAPADE